MKKILLALILLLLSKESFASSLTMKEYPIYAFTCNGCTPGITENDIANSGIIPVAGGVQIIDTSDGDTWQYKTGSNGSYEWWTLGQFTPIIDNNPGRSLVSVAAAANGFQISATRYSTVRYSITITTAVQIGVVTNVDGYVVLEIASTNSATAGDWIEIGRVAQAQNIGLALALSSTQKGGGQIGGIVPVGYYARLRSVNIAGTPTYVYNSGQETLL